MTRFCQITRIGAILVLLQVLSAGAAFSQQVTGTILGRVTDTTGAVVPAATIQIQNPSTGFSRTDTADSDGRYLESNLPLGTYSVTVQKQGFKTLVRTGVAITVGSEVTVNLELAVGDVQQHVEVTGEAPSIETSNATLSGLVSQDQLRDLPLNGRSIDTLALLSPGIFANRATASNTTVGMGLHIAVNGSRTDWNLYLLDGTYINDAISGRSSAAGEALGVEGILEFRILTHGASAEYGRSAGGVISAVTRSGTNEFHGSAYEFVRNTVFNATNFFAQSLPAYHRNQFGAAVGGPILKNKLFFFANYEGLRARQAYPVTSSVPTLANRVSPNAVLAIQPYLALYPLPTGPDRPDGTAISVNNYTQPTTEDYTMARLDYKISDNDSFFGRYVYDPSTTSIPLQVPTFVANITGNDRFLVLSETHIFSASTLNEFRFAVNRTTPTQTSNPLFAVPSSLEFVPGQGFGALTFSSTVLANTGVSTLGISPNVPQNFTQNIIQESDTVTTVKGPHTIKFGVDVEREQLNVSLSGSVAGNFQFSSVANLLAAKPSTYVQQINGVTPTGGFSTPDRGWRRTLFGSFVQDDIRLRPNLTVNLGLRFEFLTDPTEVHGYSSALIGLTSSKNTPGPPFLAPKLNFAPRIGFAWDPTGSGKTSIRAAGGRYDNQLDGRAWYATAGGNADFLRTYQISNPPFPNGLANGVAAALPNNGVVQFFAKEPVVYEWNLEVQRQLVPTLSLRVGYVGSRGIHLPGPGQLNTRVPTVQPDGSLFFNSSSLKVNPNFGSMGGIFTGFSSSYNGLQMLLEKTLSAGLNFQVSYTFSKAMSSADQIVGGITLQTPGAVMNVYNLNQDYSLAALNQEQVVVANFAYQMPWDHRLNSTLAKAVLGGWAVNGIFSYGSGLPFDILDGFNNSNNSDTNNPDRPNLNSGYSTNPTSGLSQGNTAGNSTCIANGGPAAGIALHTPTLWFDPCAFSLSQAGTFGNLGRNTAIAPGFYTLDFTLVKTTHVTEKTRLEFRAECFNLFNHPNFGLPIGNISSSTRTYAANAGQITTTAIDNRELQLGLKFLF